MKNAIWNWSGAAVSLALAACGGDEGPNGGPGSGEGSTVLLAQLADPCTPELDTPEPNDFFTNADGTSEQLGCPLPSDPLQSTLTSLRRTDGAPVDLNLDGATAPNARGIRLPLAAGAGLTASSLASTAEIDLTGGSDPDGALPPILVLSQTGTRAVDFSVVDVTARRDGDDILIRLTGSDPLEFGRRYVVVATNAILDDQERPLQASDAMAYLLGERERLDDPAAEPRLDRAAERLAPALAVLAQATPAITSEDIVSIHGFTTELGPELLTQLADRYFELLENGRIPFSFDITQRSRPASDLHPAPGPTGAVQGFDRGRIRVPRFLNDSGRIDPSWDAGSGPVDTVELNFVLSVPSLDIQELVLYLPGYGRGSSDLVTETSLAQELAAAGVAVLQVDLRCHGDRSPDEQGRCQPGRERGEVEALADARQNNDLMQVLDGDFIPDSSGNFYLPGDAGSLRDTQIAQALELLHLSVLLRTRNSLLNQEGVSYNLGRLGVVVHGHGAPAFVAGLAAYGRSELAPPFRGAIFVNGGAGYEDLLTDGFEGLQESFVASGPEGLTLEDLGPYIRTLEEDVLQALDVETNASVARDLFRNSFGNVDNLVFIDPNQSTNIPESARARLREAFGMQGVQRQTFAVSCDDFLVFPCRANELDATNLAQELVVESIAN